MRRCIRARGARTGELPLILVFLALAPPFAFADPGDAPALGVPAPGPGSAEQSLGTRRLLREMESAYRDDDLAAAAALIDFPLVVTITSPDGRTLDLRLGPEEWLAAMEPRFNGRTREREAGHPPAAATIADPLAWIANERTMVERPSSRGAIRRSLLVVRKHGKLLVKAIVGRSRPAPDALPEPVAMVAIPPGSAR